MGRQVELRWGTTTIDLNSTTYVLQANNGFVSAGTTLEIKVLVQPTTLTALDRLVAPLRRAMHAAQLYASQEIGTAVEVWTKTCDDLTPTAEIGATWRKKQVLGGSVDVQGITGTAAAPAAFLVLKLEVDDLWQRAATEPILVAAAAADFTINSDGSLTVADGKSLTARRVSWTASGGLTMRVRWAYADVETVFVRFSASYEGRAIYHASDNKLYIYDCAGNVASSSALSVTAGDEMDLVFKWDPAAPKMGIWVNGIANGSAAACFLGFGMGADLLSNSGFETGGTGGNFNAGAEIDDGTSDTWTGWGTDYVNDGAGNKIEATATKYIGNYAIKITYTTAAPVMYQTAISVTAGQMYKLSMYTRGDGTQAGRYSIYDVTNGVYFVPITSTGITGTAYTAVTHIFAAPAGCAAIEIALHGPAAAGTVYFDAISIIDASGDTDTYQLFNPTSGICQLLSAQLWPEVLTDAQCAGLGAWGRPEPELAVCVTPSDLKTTNAAYRFYNIPGEADALLRIALSDATQAYDQARLGIRPLRIQTAVKFECEDGTNGSDVLDAADATASGGNVAQFTPTDSASATRSTLVLAANPADVAAFYGQYRLLLAVKDNAASVGINLISWRLVIAGVNGDYSSEYYCAAVSQYSLLDLGTFRIPPDAWPDETESVTGDVHAGSYMTLEIAVRNTVGSGGGTLNLDAVYLQPMELEGILVNAAWTTSQYQILDFVSRYPAHIAVADYRTLEFAGWGEYPYDVLSLAPVCGAAGLAQVFALRDTVEKYYPNDAITVWWWIAPRWM